MCKLHLPVHLRLVYRIYITSFTKRTDVKSRSREIGCYNDRIALKLDRHVGSAPADVPVIFQSKRKSLNTNLAASRRRPSTSKWRHNGRDSVSNHQPHDCFLNRVFRRRSKKTSKLCVTGLCAGNSPVTGEFPAQMASDAGNFHLMTSSWTNEPLSEPVMD